MRQPSYDSGIEDITEDDFLDSIDDDDYVFVMDKDGHLKTVLMPEISDSGSIPESIVDMLKLFGINSLDPTTLH